MYCVFISVFLEVTDLILAGAEPQLHFSQMSENLN